MTQSKGPGTSGGTAVGAKKRRSPIQRLRPYAVGAAAMVVVFGASALIGAHVRSKKDDKVSAPTGAVAAASQPGSKAPAGPDLDIPVNPTVPVSVTVFEDLRSPDSKAFQEEYGAVLQQLLSSGQVRVHYRLVIPTDAQYGGKGSLVAANAAACAQDQGRFTRFVDEVWKNQPSAPQDDALKSVKLMEKLGRQAGGIKADTFEPCVEQRDHEGWVLASQHAFAAAKSGGVPLVQINGVTVKNMTSLTPASLRSQVQDEVKRVVALKATPSRTPALQG